MPSTRTVERALTRWQALPHNRLEAMRVELDQAEEGYLRSKGWATTCNTPGSYWMWEKTVTGREHYKGDTAHNRVWLVSKDEALRLQAHWDAHDYAAAHPEEFND